MIPWLRGPAGHGDGAQSNLRSGGNGSDLDLRLQLLRGSTSLQRVDPHDINDLPNLAGAHQVQPRPHYDYGVRLVYQERGRSLPRAKLVVGAVLGVQRPAAALDADVLHRAGDPNLIALQRCPFVAPRWENHGQEQRQNDAA